MSKRKASLEEIMNNLQADRGYATLFLNDLREWIAKDQSRYSQNGLVVAKFLEAAQRSTEMMIKLLDLQTKKSGQIEDISFDKDEEDTLYEEIKEVQDKKK